MWKYDQVFIYNYYNIWIANILIIYNYSIVLLNHRKKAIFFQQNIFVADIKAIIILSGISLLIFNCFQIEFGVISSFK